MDVFVPGVLKRLDTVPAGACFMFRFENTTRIGIMTADGQGRTGILDPEAVNNEGKNWPAVYLVEDYYNEDVLHFENARIVPLIKTNIMKFGYYSDGMPSKALYISDKLAVILAVRNQKMLKFDLATGRIAQRDVAYCIHTTQWNIEVPNQNGDYEVLAEFSA